MTLEEWSEKMRPHMVEHAVRMLTQPNPLYDRLMETYKPEPPTIREQIAMHLRNIRDGWLVMTGRASISDDIW